MDESYYTDFCIGVWFWIKTTDRTEIAVSEVKEENREKWITAVKAYIDHHRGQPEVLFNSDYSILTIYQRT